ncbi:MAG: peptidylprolyl isomerase [Planctomycetota bacterium]|nr:peptidylprolyl isomerase [Planctomycetota bacterium]
MADHKAPTQVSIAPYEEASRLQKMVSTYSVPFFVLVIIASGAILWVKSNQDSVQADRDASWNKLTALVSMEDIASGAELPGAAALGSLAKELQATPAGPWTKALEVRSLVDDKDWPGAEAALAELESQFPNHNLVAQQLPVGPNGSLQTMAGQLRDYIKSQREFVTANPQLYKLPPLPEGSPQLTIATTAGDITVGLYQDRAPEHVANFIKLALNGYYVDTKFHRVIPGFMVQGGDPNTKTGAQSEWGQGGPEYKIPAELSDLYHFKGVLAAAKMPGDTESSGSQFYFTTGDPHHLDGEHTVFGVILDGAATVRVMENAPIQPGTEVPEEPTSITGITVL